MPSVLVRQWHRLGWADPQEPQLHDSANTDIMILIGDGGRGWSVHTLDWLDLQQFSDEQVRIGKGDAIGSDSLHYFAGWTRCYEDIAMLESLEMLFTNLVLNSL